MMCQDKTLAKYVLLGLGASRVISAGSCNQVGVNLMDMSTYSSITDGIPLTVDIQSIGIAGAGGLSHPAFQ